MAGTNFFDEVGMGTDLLQKRVHIQNPQLHPTVRDPNQHVKLDLFF